MIAGPVESMDHVELLVLLADRAPHSWTVGEAATAVHCEEPIAAKCLAGLHRAGLVQSDDTGGGIAYRFAPTNAEVKSAVGELSAMYHQKPVTLVRAVYGRVPNAVRSFADAFRIRDPDPR